jgi:hypothetical protein
MSYKVFISYSWSNSAERRAMISELNKLERVKVLVDKDQISPGMKIHQRISEIIDDSDCIIALLTKHGISSKEVFDEIVRAHERKKDIIPVVEEDVNISELPWYLRDTLYIKYDKRDFDSTLEYILKAIKQKASPLQGVNQQEFPPRLQKVYEKHKSYFDIPTNYGISKEKIFLELKMKETDSSHIIRVSKDAEIGEVAEFIVIQLLPHLRVRDYEWTFNLNGRIMPPEHTFISSGIKNGDTIYLHGNSRRPEWSPNIR